jgi:sec-independent protein translocase protein TatB
MFDLTSSKLLILAIVALIVVGPKDLPILLRTVGKYLGVVRRHAAEFRAQFDEALREAELQDVKKEIEGIGHEMRASLEQGGAAIDEHVMSARTELDGVIGGRPRPPASENEPSPAAAGEETPPLPPKSEAP